MIVEPGRGKNRNAPVSPRDFRDSRGIMPNADAAFELTRRLAKAFFSTVGRSAQTVVLRGRTPLIRRIRLLTGPRIRQAERLMPLRLFMVSTVLRGLLPVRRRLRPEEKAGPDRQTSGNAGMILS